MDRDDIIAYIEERASHSEEPEEFAHWVHGANEFADIGCDESTDFCLACCKVMVANIYKSHPEKAERVGVCVDGGWGTEHSSTPFCDGCGCELAGSFTGLGAQEELHALTHESAPDHDDTHGWRFMRSALDAVTDDDPAWTAVGEVVEASIRIAFLWLLASRPEAS